jgi:hypothetical protein
MFEGLKKEEDILARRTKSLGPMNAIDDSTLARLALNLDFSSDD